MNDFENANTTRKGPTIMNVILIYYALRRVCDFNRRQNGTNQLTLGA